MKLTDALLGEHGALRAMFTHVLTTLPRVDSAGEVKRLTELLSAALLSHAHLEDDLLFPALEARLGPVGPVVVMREEHREIDEALAAAAAATERGEIAAHLREAIEIAIPHFAKEEAILFVLADDLLADDELHRLGRVWATTRGVETP